VGEVIAISRILNVASVLLFIVAIFGVVFGILYLVADPLEGKVLEVTESEIRAFNSDVMDAFTLVHRTEGLYIFCLSLALCFISLVPFRKGEKWAWYLTFGIFGIALVGQAILTYIGSNVLAEYYLPAAILLVILWIGGLLLPVKKFFS
jgi:hypothetical protein